MGYTVKHTLTILLLIFSVSFVTGGCRSYKKMVNEHKRNRDMRKMAKEQRKKEKEAQQAYQDAVKHHAQNQTRKTRKEMKRNYRKSERLRTGKKEFFLKRWFKRKQRRGRTNPT